MNLAMFLLSLALAYTSAAGPQPAAPLRIPLSRLTVFVPYPVPHFERKPLLLLPESQVTIVSPAPVVPKPRKPRPADLD